MTADVYLLVKKSKKPVLISMKWEQEKIWKIESKIASQ